MRKFLPILSVLLLPLSAFATNYYVTQSGTGTGTSSSSPWSVANYNASTKPTGGDTVFVSGTITSTLSPGSGGTSSAPLIIDASAADFTPASGSAALIISSDYVTFTQGGTFSGGSGNLKSHVQGGTMKMPSKIASYPNNFLIHADGGQGNISIDGVTVIGNGTDQLGNFFSGRMINNLTIQNCYGTGAQDFFFADSGPPHDITLQNNYWVTGTNITGETDVVHFGDAYNVTIQGNFFRNIAPGASASRHNDVIQCYQSGGWGSASPYNLIIRYNWIETEGTTAVDPATSGDMSWLMLESLAGGSKPSCKIYGNVFRGFSDSVANNGICANANGTGAWYVYNNTVITSAGRPGNTIRFLANTGTESAYIRNNVGYDPTGAAGTYLTWEFKVGALWNCNWFYNWNNPLNLITGLLGAPNTNPQLTSPSTGDFSTSSTSPLRGKGDSTLGSEYNQGIASGAKWPNPTLVARGSSWDVGAYQSSGGSSSEAPSNAKISVTVP